MVISEKSIPEKFTSMKYWVPIDPGTKKPIGKWKKIASWQKYAPDGGPQGFMLLNHVGIDIDNYNDPRIKAFVEPWINEAKEIAYVEISFSDNGVHIIGPGHVETMDGCEFDIADHTGVAFYSPTQEGDEIVNGRQFVLTGKKINTGEIIDISEFALRFYEATKKWHAEMIGIPAEGVSIPIPTPESSVTDEITERVYNIPIADFIEGKVDLSKRQVKNTWRVWINAMLVMKAHGYTQEQVTEKLSRVPGYDADKMAHDLDAYWNKPETIKKPAKPAPTCPKCGQEILFNDSIKAKSGKKVPLELDGITPHDCGNVIEREFEKPEDIVPTSVSPGCIAHYAAGEVKEHVQKDFYMLLDGIMEVVSWTDKKGILHEVTRRTHAWTEFVIHRIINDKNPNPLKRYDFLLNGKEYRDVPIVEMLKLGPFQPILTGVTRHVFEHMVDLYVESAKIPEQETADICGFGVNGLSLPPQFACKFPTGIQEDLRGEVEKMMALPVLSRDEAIMKFQKLRNAISFPHRDIIMSWGIGSFFAHALQRVTSLMVGLAIWGPGGLGRSEIMKKVTTDFWGVNEVISSDTFNAASRALDFLAIMTFPRTIDELHKAKDELRDLLKDHLGSHGKKRGTRKKPDQTLAMNNELDTAPSFIWQLEIPTLFDDAYLLQRFLVLYCEPFERTDDQIEAWKRDARTVEEQGSMIPGELGRYVIDCVKNWTLADLLERYNNTTNPDKSKLPKEAPERAIIEYKVFQLYKNLVKEFFDTDLDLEDFERLIKETRLLCSDLVFDVVEQLCAVSYVHSQYNKKVTSRAFNTMAFFTETDDETHKGTEFHLSSLNCAEIGKIARGEKYGLGDLSSTLSRKWQDCKFDNNKKVEGKYARAIHIPYKYVADKIDELVQLEGCADDSENDSDKPKKSKIFPCKFCQQDVMWPIDYQKGDRPVNPDGSEHQCNPAQNEHPAKDPAQQTLDGESVKAENEIMIAKMNTRAKWEIKDFVTNNPGCHSDDIERYFKEKLGGAYSDMIDDLIQELHETGWLKPGSALEKADTEVP